MTNSKKLIHVGPGGLKCPCCAPAPGSKERRKMFRLACRKAKQMDIQEGITDYLNNEDSE